MADESKKKESQETGPLTYDGNGWWNLPKTPQENPDPSYEGPVGGPWLRQTVNWVTYAGRAHATVRAYLIIAIMLSVITFLEYKLFTVHTFGVSGRNAIMLILSLFKFSVVVAFFMHLRFEKRLYSYIFVACMVLGIAVFLAVLLLQRHHGFGYS